MVPKKAKISLVASVKTSYVPLADPREVALNLGPVVERNAFRYAWIRYQVLDSGNFEDIWHIFFKSLMMADYIIGNVTGSAEFSVC